MSLVCIFCHRGLKDGLSLSRINEKGVPGIWACREHRHLSDKKFNPEDDRLVDLIAAAGLQKKKNAP